ncbi:Rieske (2Fe-2S) protein [Nocardioides furvisabuli]|nr:Rieske (2Fe-2S) protein [Nocardioides furvisabuli]
MTAINRRRALAGSAAVAVGVPLLAACGDDADTSAADPATSSGSDPSSPSEDGAAAGGVVLASAGDVPVGGGTIVDAEKVVVTQPTEGDFKAFSSICTHQGCPVTAISDGAINCTCHGSRFSIEDGSPLAGPATAALAAVEITVDGDSITRA